ncbi:MAG: ComF family protein [Bryobacterales bacterium]|nr:ComF family protein [Bryobacterales bacterium]
MPDAFRRRADKGLRGLVELVFPLLFPDDCRVCGEALREVSRVPVCAKCLRDPQPLVAEYFCVACKTPFVNAFPLDESGRCTLCRLGLTGFDAVYTYGSYEGSLRKLIHLFKFEKIHTLAVPLGKFLARALPREERFDAIVPMPLYWMRRWERGFNQSELLAREIGRGWNVPVKRAVRRVKATDAQAGLTNAKRRANVSGAFAARKNANLKGARVLLVDDVMTTGATAAACARALKHAGAAHVALLAVARTDRRAAVQSFELASLIDKGRQSRE